MNMNTNTNTNIRTNMRTNPNTDSNAAQNLSDYPHLSPQIQHHIDQMTAWVKDRPGAGAVVCLKNGACSHLVDFGGNNCRGCPRAWRSNYGEIEFYEKAVHGVSGLEEVENAERLNCDEM
jgi:hypothetical protein